MLKFVLSDWSKMSRDHLSLFDRLNFKALAMLIFLSDLVWKL